MVILRWFQNLRPKLKKILLQIKQKKKTTNPRLWDPLAKRIQDSETNQIMEILRSVQNFPRLCFSKYHSIPLILLWGLQRGKYFNVLNHNGHNYHYGKTGNSKQSTPRLLSVYQPTYPCLYNHLPTLVPPSIPPTYYPCLPTYQSPSSTVMGATARKRIKGF